MNDTPRRIQHDAYQKAMNAAMHKYTGEKAMQDADKNPLDSLIKPKDESDHTFSKNG